jgi:hypothetical protein
MVTTNDDIAVDFMDMTNNGRLWTRLADVRNEVVPVAGQCAVVGCEDAEPAVAQTCPEERWDLFANIVVPAPATNTRIGAKSAVAYLEKYEIRKPVWTSSPSTGARARYRSTPTMRSSPDARSDWPLRRMPIWRI